ncbi:MULTISPECIES: response regulator [Cyanophyceae]|uniref:response regulator n=1 Tax=Cyanophyceae TaxID=3028117 RepID=UPI00168812AF|nr:response regulator [Trichocoleus sp. FACHB-40]MBD2005083.1 response regulator [Trichocoleus sp. FACHB-40]
MTSPEQSINSDANSNTQQEIVKQPMILVVEDNEDNLLLLSEVLLAIDCSFITTTNGNAAILLAQTYQPKLILLDILLPDMNGEEVVYNLKQNPQTMAIPIVAVTALARPGDRENLLFAGCSDYISKPYLIDDLETIIFRYLGQF